MPDSDDENDSCVFFGTPLIDLLPEDAKFSVKPKRVEEQIVTDEKGRQRFHGAFTGGFSAGYFNTVGSKEGWEPSVFKSSRSERQKSQKSMRPEDFMDEEDFAEHGIAPKSVQVKSDYNDPAAATAASTQKNNSSRIGVKASDHALDDLIRPTRNTIGVRMLRKMGWREGQGIGPKIKRRLRKLKAKVVNQPGKKLYGVALPSEGESEEDDENIEDEYLVSTFNTEQFQFEVKEDYFGLGYKRLDVGSLFGKTSGDSASGAAAAAGGAAAAAESESPAASLLFPSLNKSAKKANKKSIGGQAFGVGDFEDDEDVYDVYKQDSIESYDFELGGAQQRDVRKALGQSYGFAGAADMDDPRDILKKFVVSKQKLMPARVYEAPDVPAGFDLRHRIERRSRFDDTVGARVDAARATDSTDTMSVYIKSVSKRSEILGEEPIQPDSVLDLVSAADREFLKNKQTAAANATSEKATAKPSLKTSLESEQDKRAKRYESYVGFIKKGYKDPYSFVDTKDLTEWEKVKEKEDFENKYAEHLRKLEAIKRDTAKSFVSLSRLTENNQEVEIAVNKSETEMASIKRSSLDTEFTKPLALIENEAASGVELNDMQKAAKEKRYGAATRTEFVWRPHPVVCKRFNVKNPYPDSKEFGTLKEERRKTTIKEFNMLTLMSAASRFDRGKSKNLFAEINADTVEKKPGLQPQQQPASKPQGPQEETQSREKLEFDTKTVPADSSSSQSDYISILSEETTNRLDKKENASKKSESESIGIDLKNNIYLQERPSFDIFKEIFENDDDDEKDEAVNDEDDEEITTNSKDSNPAKDVEIIEPEPRPDPKVSVVKSSLGDVDVDVINKYLGGTKRRKGDSDDEEDDEDKHKDDKEQKTALFRQLVSNLAASKKRDESSSSSSKDSSSSSDSSEEELVYEEVSISSAKKSHKEKKKKKKHHKKKSKKSHHKKLKK